MRLWYYYVAALSVRYAHVWSGLVSAPGPMGTQNVNTLHGFVKYGLGAWWLCVGVRACVSVWPTPHGRLEHEHMVFVCVFCFGCFSVVCWDCVCVVG